MNPEALTVLNELVGPDARIPQDTSEGVLYDADMGFIEDRQSVSLFFGVLPIQKPVTRIGEAINPSSEGSFCNFGGCRRIYYPDEGWLVCWNLTSFLLLIVFAIIVPIEIAFDFEVAEYSTVGYVFYKVAESGRLRPSAAAS